MITVDGGEGRRARRGGDRDGGGRAGHRHRDRRGRASPGPGVARASRTSARARSRAGAWRGPCAGRSGRGSRRDEGAGWTGFGGRRPARSRRDLAAPGRVVLAVGLDLAAGEPPARWHPVVWLGRALGWAERRAPGRSVADGAAAVAAVTAVAWAAARLVATATRRLGWPGVVLEALASSPRSPCAVSAEATGGVESALRAGDLAAARARVGRDLVSRPTGELAADEVASAAIESAAENLVDSIAARSSPTPWAGSPPRGPIARSTRPTRCGGTATPATSGSARRPRGSTTWRISFRRGVGAAALAAGAALAGEDGRGAARVAWAQHRRTASPNAGWPMAAMAGALRVGPREARRLPARRRGRCPPRPTRSAGRGGSWAGRPRSPSCWPRALRSSEGRIRGDAPPARACAPDRGGAA